MKFKSQFAAAVHEAWDEAALEVSIPDHVVGGGLFVEVGSFSWTVPNEHPWALLTGRKPGGALVRWLQSDNPANKTVLARLRAVAAKHNMELRDTGRPTIMGFFRLEQEKPTWPTEK